MDVALEFPNSAFINKHFRLVSFSIRKLCEFVSHCRPLRVTLRQHKFAQPWESPGTLGDNDNACLRQAKLHPGMDMSKAI